MKTTLRFSDELYKKHYFFGAGKKGYDYLKKEMNRRGMWIDSYGTGEFSKEENLGLCYLRGDFTFIWVNAKSDIPTLAHECLHAVTDTFARKGIPIDSNCDEAAAHYLSYLISKIVE